VSGGHDLHKFCPQDGKALPFDYEHCPWHGDALGIIPTRS
jgi:hypothetical protein